MRRTSHWTLRLADLILFLYAVILASLIGAVVIATVSDL